MHDEAKEKRRQARTAERNARFEALNDPSRDPSLGTVDNPLPPMAPYGLVIRKHD